jgi:hypothetical protein
MRAKRDRSFDQKIERHAAPNSVQWIQPLYPEKKMIKRAPTIAWSVVMVALFVELSLGARTAYDVVHPRPATPTPVPPTPTLFVPSATPEGWKLYTSPRLGISLYYPENWEPLPADSLNQTTIVDAFKSADGFFELDTVKNTTSIDKLCDLQAHGHAEYFGASPMTTREQVANLPACLIEPGNDRPALLRSQALLQSPWLNSSYDYISLSSDPAHFLRIVASVSLDPNRRLASTPTVAPIATPLPTQFLPTPSLLTTRAGDLTIEEYAVVSVLIDTPNHFEFKARIPPDFFARRQEFRAPNLAARIIEANTLMAPMGWRFAQSSSSTAPGEPFDVYQNDRLVNAGLQAFTPVQVNASDKDFMSILTDNAGVTWMLQRSGLTRWDNAHHLFTPPVFVGDEMVNLETVETNTSQVSVARAGKTVFTLTLDTTTNSPHFILGSLGSQWILNVNGLLFQDGRLVNKELGYDEIAAWQLLNGKPFYFFTHSGKVGIAYNDSVLPIGYDDVIRDACCDQAAFNATGNSNLAWFYASKNGLWEYVEIGVFPK